MDFKELERHWKGKRILVTGHTGFKGAWLSELLLLLGAEVTGYALEPPTEPSLFELLNLGSRMRSVTGDIRNPGSLREVFRETQPEYVLHMAAQPIVRRSYEEPALTYETNVMGTVNLLECVRETASVRSVVNVTTDKVYRNRELGEAFREEERLDGYDPYSNSKSCSELVTASYVRSFFRGRKPVSTARAGNVIGGGDFARDRILPDCVRAAEQGKPVFLRNPAAIRPFQHVLEPLTVYLMLLQKQEEKPELSGAYNVGPEESDCVSAEKLVQLFSRAYGQGFSYEIRPDGGPHEAGFLKLDCGKVKKTFGWRPVWNVEQAVSKTAEWARAYLSGSDMREVTDRQIMEFFGETIHV